MNAGKMRRQLQRQRLSWARESAGLPAARPPVALSELGRLVTCFREGLLTWANRPAQPWNLVDPSVFFGGPLRTEIERKIDEARPVGDPEWRMEVEG